MYRSTQQVRVLSFSDQQAAVPEGMESEPISQMNVAQVFPDHGSGPTPEKHPRNMQNFIRS